MKTTRYKIWMALALALATGWSANAQRRSFGSFGTAPTVPGPTDYNQFAQFITTRNIFNPQRYAIRGAVAPPVSSEPRYAPQFTLVGTMNYEKGLFAFFDSNESNYRKVLYTTDTNGIAGYVVTNISTGGVTLLSPDKKETVELKIGDSMVQEGTMWRLAMAGRNAFSGGGGRNNRFGGFSGGNNFNSSYNNSSYNNSSGSSYNSGDNMAPATDSSSPAAPSAPSSSLDGNDVLKRLMQQREQEMK